MKRRLLALLCAMTVVLAAGCAGGSAGNTDAGNGTESQETGGSENAGAADAQADSAAGDASQVAGEGDTAEAVEVVEDWMVPLYADSLRDGTYEITVDSSSPMFNIIACDLTVRDGAMTAVMTMSGTGYRMVCMGTAQEAAGADEGEYIPYQETAEGLHTFTVPVEALDMGIDCAAFSDRKEMWYDRTLVFRSDSLPLEAFAEGVVTTPESLGLADGEYLVDVELTGGSGRASVASPAALHVQDGQVAITLVWGSDNYDYMLVEGQRYDTTIVDGASTFTIPVTCFDWKMPVVADTVAMSVPTRWPTPWSWTPPPSYRRHDGPFLLLGGRSGAAPGPGRLRRPGGGGGGRGRPGGGQRPRLGGAGPGGQPGAPVRRPVRRGLL